MPYAQTQSAIAHVASTVVAELVVTRLGGRAGDAGLPAPDV